jgi:superfamily I DNA and RNA helicase
MLNYRSPERIARFVNAVLPELPFTCANDLPGLGTGTVFYDDPSEQPRLVGRVVGRLLNERFRPQDIAVLSCRGLESTAFKEVERVGNHTLARFTGEYDLFGNQVYSKGQILFDTVRRFKGQQAAAVILTDVAPREHHLIQELQVLFCGMTRATVRLDLVCHRENAWVEERLAGAA